MTHMEEIISENINLRNTIIHLDAIQGIVEQVKKSEKDVLLIGAPFSGKRTVLREYANQMLQEQNVPVVTFDVRDINLRTNDLDEFKSVVRLDMASRTLGYINEHFGGSRLTTLGLRNNRREFRVNWEQGKDTLQYTSSVLSNTVRKCARKSKRTVTAELGLVNLTSYYPLEQRMIQEAGVRFGKKIILLNYGSIKLTDAELKRRFTIVRCDFGKDKDMMRRIMNLRLRPFADEMDVFDLVSEETFGKAVAESKGNMRHIITGVSNAFAAYQEGNTKEAVRTSFVNGIKDAKEYTKRLYQYTWKFSPVENK